LYTNFKKWNLILIFFNIFFNNINFEYKEFAADGVRYIELRSTPRQNLEKGK